MHTLNCDVATCKDGEVRLADGTSEREGRVEVCISQEWGDCV